MIIEIRHLRLMQSIRREGSVSAAARALHLTQPAVSHALRDLEDRLGVCLFNRVRRAMVTTAEGERLLRAADVIIEEVRRTEHDVEQLRLGNEGVIRIATECYTCYNWLPALLRDFHESFPGVDVQVMPEATNRPLDALLGHELDLALMENRPVCDGVQAKRLFGDEMVVVVPPEHRFAGRRYLEAKDFAEEHLIVQREPESSTIFREVLLPAGITPKRVSQIPLTEAVLQMVGAGIGVTVLAQWLAQAEVDAGRLVAVRVTRKGLRRTWHAVMRDKQAISPALAYLVRQLRANASEAAGACALR